MGEITTMPTNQPLKERIQKAPIASDQEGAEVKLKDLITALEEQPNWSNLIETEPNIKSLLLSIFGNSSFLSNLILRTPKFFFEAIEATPEVYMAELSSELKKLMKDANNASDAMQALRQFKQRAALFIALTDLSSCWEVPDIIHAVTQTADISLKEAVDFLLRQAAIKGDYHPENPEQPSQDSGYIILAMGKQGAHELNYSSDVDLIVLFDNERIKLKPGLDPATFFVRLTRNLVKLMQEYTSDGYVFRVDLRLRPDPGATQIALSTDAAYAYYESFGQNWERAAMIKARPCAGDIEAGDIFLKGLAPFIWRKYLDFAAIDDIHAMKRQIHTFKGHGEIAIEGHNIKLGRGGIREIEFFTQTQQLIAGGRQPDLRTLKTLETLKRLAEKQWIKPEAESELSKAYQFLRRIEHRLQMINDEQTHSLPTDQPGMQRIANFSGFETIETFREALKQQLEIVQSHYEGLFEDDESLASSCGNLVFVGDEPDLATIDTLSKLGFKEPERAIETVRSWHFGRYRATRSERARERLTEFQPLLLEAIAKTSEPDEALKTFDRFLKALPAGVQLFSLLSTNPNLLRLVAEIMGTAPSLARILGRRARVLDAVLDPGFFGDLPSDEELHQLIEQQFSTCIDYQDTLDRARVIGQEQSFLTGVRFLSGVINANQAAIGYTRLAEAVIQELQAKVIKEMEQIHGSFKGAAISVIAMGKLGGEEMTATSDLDLIIIYDVEEGEQQSDGKKPLSPTQYYARLTQRLISALSAPTAEGELYEVDMRLRPSGRAGPVATHIKSFEDYQHNLAWVWEHMALTRARPITGPEKLKQRLNSIIKNVLETKRDSTKLMTDVKEMREKIDAEKATQNIWDLKQVRGGQVDLEFINQYLQLKEGARYPEILKTNTAQSYEMMKAREILDSEIINKLINTAHMYQNLSQMIRLCTEDGKTLETAADGLKQKLAEIIDQPSFSALKATLKTTQLEIKKIYDDLLI